MKRQLFFQGVIIISLFMTTSAFAQTNKQVKMYNLKYKMKSGSEFTFYSLGYGKRFSRNNPKLEFISSRDRELVQDYRVITSDENGTRFELQYQKLIFDDRKNIGDNIVTEFLPLIGKKVQYTMSLTGELYDFDGFDRLPDISYPGGTMTGDIHRQEITHMFPVFPSNPVAIGDTWSRNAFGYNIEYKVLSEIKFHGYDCVRIFAQMSLEQKTTKGKDENRMDYIREANIPYSDIYYFAYKEGMIIYRFSVSSMFEIINRTSENDINNHVVGDQIWEEHIIFK